MADHFTISVVPPEGDIRFSSNADDLEDRTSPIFPLPLDLIAYPSVRSDDFQDAYSPSLMALNNSPAFSTFSNLSPLGTSASVTGPSTPLMDSFSGFSLTDGPYSEYYQPREPAHWHHSFNSTSFGDHGLSYAENVPTSSSCPLSPVSMPSDVASDVPAGIGHSSLGLYLTDAFEAGSSTLVPHDNETTPTPSSAFHSQRFLTGSHNDSFSGFSYPSTSDVHSNRAPLDRRRHSISVVSNQPSEQSGLKRRITVASSTRSHRPYDRSPGRFTTKLGNPNVPISPHAHRHNLSDEMVIPAHAMSTPNSPNHWHAPNKVPKDVVGSPAIDKASSARRKKEALFECDKCGKKLTTKQNLQHHINAHNDERNYICELCTKAFVTPTTLSRHAKKCHL